MIKSTELFRGPWGQEVIFTGFYLEFLSFWISRLFDLSDLGNLRWGSGTFFKNYIFEISAFQWKDEVCHNFLVEIFTKSLHRGGVCGVLCTANFIGHIGGHNLHTFLLSCSAIILHLLLFSVIFSQYACTNQPFKTTKWK